MWMLCNIPFTLKAHELLQLYCNSIMWKCEQSNKAKVFICPLAQKLWILAVIFCHSSNRNQTLGCIGCMLTSLDVADGDRLLPEKYYIHASVSFPTPALVCFSNFLFTAWQSKIFPTQFEQHFPDIHEIFPATFYLTKFIIFPLML